MVVPLKTSGIFQWEISSFTSVEFEDDESIYFHWKDKYIKGRRTFYAEKCEHKHFRFSPLRVAPIVTNRAVLVSLQ